MLRYDIYEGGRTKIHEDVDEAWVVSALRSGRITIFDRVRVRPTGRGRDERRDEGPAPWRHVGDVPRLARRAPGGQFRLSRVRAPATPLDLTPLVDVSFLLLLFFMLTATFTLQKTIEVPRPDESDGSTSLSLPTLDDLRRDNIIVSVDADNTIWVEDKRTERAYLAGVLRKTSRRADKTDLVLRAHEDAACDTVVAVVDAANEAGMERIRIANETSDARGP